MFSETRVVVCYTIAVNKDTKYHPVFVGLPEHYTLDIE